MTDIRDVLTTKEALRAFLSTRCDVSSQHKLPTEEDILSTHMVKIFGKEAIQKALNQMLEDGETRLYGPYISDRQIDVL